MALLVFGVIDLGVMLYGYNQPSAFGTLVGATAIIPYIIYFLITRGLRGQAAHHRQPARRVQPRPLGLAGDQLRARLLAC